ncbi:MAG: outer membrane beta-barrel protein [Gammaproteobacteria bacterium]|nr:outer membrane beta-barrel protein [Gammaproteobacteria bacterium]
MIKKIGVLVLLASCASVAFADFTPEAYVQHPNSFSRRDNWIVGGSLGVAWTGLGDSSTTVPNQTVDGISAPPDLYSIQSPSSTAAFSLFAGYQWRTLRKLFPDYTVAFRYQHLDSATASGTIDLYSFPGFTDYDYSVDASSNLFSLFGKVDIYEYYSFAPYVSLGLGIADNTLDSYKETPYSGIDQRNNNPNGPNYASGSTDSFMYDLGFGVDYFINPRLSLSLGYEYADLGSLSTGTGVLIWENQKLSLGDLTTNTVLLSLFYQLPLGY